MTKFRSTCTFCGDVVLRPDELVITVYAHEARYEFDCPICETPMEHPAHKRVRDVLLAVGVVEQSAAPLPESISDLLRALRSSATYERDLSNDLIELASVRTVEDIGWES